MGWRGVEVDTPEIDGMSWVLPMFLYPSPGDK